MGRVTAYRTDPDLAGKFIDEGFDALRSMAGHGVRFLPMYGRQSFERDGKARFWGGLAVEAWGGGPRLLDSLARVAGRLGVEIRYGVRAQARKLDGVDAKQALATLAAFNAAVDVAMPFDPAAKDGRAAIGIDPPRSNWANRLDAPPFEAYGITFTFGGLHVDADAKVIGDGGAPIPGLYAAGEIVGGLFYFNYLGGAGLTAGAVFGRAAGRRAAARS